MVETIGQGAALDAGSLATGEVLCRAFAAIMCAMLSLQLKSWMQSGMILRRYYLWLCLRWMRLRRKPKSLKRMMLKPMGLCIDCYSVWVFSASYCLLFGFDLWLPLFGGLSFATLKISQAHGIG